MKKRNKTRVHLITYCQGFYQSERIRNYVLGKGVQISSKNFYEMVAKKFGRI